MPTYHPQLDEHGKAVLLKFPSKPTPLSSWHQADAIATVTPGAQLPSALNGIPLEQWLDVPHSREAWNKVEGQLDFDEPPFQVPKGKAAAAGVAIQESDGRIWLVAPSNGFAGYTTTLPKGRIDDKVNRQASAIREAYEEAGLKVKITGFLGDSERTQTFTRYYLAERVGGNPAYMGWESQAVHLVPCLNLATFLNHPNDQSLLTAILALEASKFIHSKKKSIDSPIADSRRILLLDLGTEGCAVRLFLEPNELGIFSYKLETHCSERYLFPDVDFPKIQKKKIDSVWRDTHPLVIDWAGALQLMDDTGWAWPVFSPEFVHPSIRISILNALKDRYSRFPHIRFEDWEQARTCYGGENNP